MDHYWGNYCESITNTLSVFDRGWHFKTCLYPGYQWHVCACAVGLLLQTTSIDPGLCSVDYRFSADEMSLWLLDLIKRVDWILGRVRRNLRFVMRSVYFAYRLKLVEVVEFPPRYFTQVIFWRDK